MQVSVVIPCYNCAETIERAVDSVFSQSYKDWELILVNNNSKDNTLEKLVEIKGKNPKSEITILNENKKGAPAARNKGLYAAKGKWIQFLDADDQLLPNKIEKQLAIFSDSDLIIGGAILQSMDGSQEIRPLNEDIWIGLIKSELGITSANLFRRDNLLEINGWNESFSSSQEYELMFRLLCNNAKTNFVTDTDTIIYDSQMSISRDHNSARIEQIVKNRMNLRFLVVDYLKKENKLNDRHQKAVKESVMNNLLFYGNAIPAYSWKVFLKNMSFLNPTFHDFKHLIMITFFTKNK